MNRYVLVYKDGYTAEKWANNISDLVYCQVNGSELEDIVSIVWVGIVNG